MSRFHLRYAQAASCVVPLVASTFIGLNLSQWLAGAGLRSSSGPGGSATLSIHIPKTPDPAVTETWVGLFHAAKSEIWLATGRLESEAILRALDEASKRGVAVHLTLSPAQNPGPDSGARAWLRDKTSLRDVRVSSDAFDGTGCVVDGTYTVITGQGLLAAAASAKDAGIFFYAANTDIGAALKARLAAQYAAAEAEAGPSP